MYLPAYSQNGCYKVTKVVGNWSDTDQAASTDPGVDSSTVLKAVGGTFPTVYIDPLF